MVHTCQPGRQLAGLVLPLALVLLANCGGSPTETPPPPPPPAPVVRRSLASMFLGADISALERIEQGGGAFRDAGQPGDAIAILRARGANTFRLRLFVNPNGQEVQVNDLEYTVRMATRVKAAGAKFLLDIHYSDTWADPAHQVTPAAWAGLDIAALEQQVETWSAAVMTRLKFAGALPDIVQVGNEIDSGMLWPLGRVGGAYDTPSQWNQLARLLKAAIRGLRSPLAAGDAVRIMLQYGQGGNEGGTQWFFDHVNQNGVPYELIGLSYYPWWHGTIGALRANLQATAGRYNREIVVVETSYPWRAGGWESMVSSQAAMTWPVSAQGQAQFLTDLLEAVATVRDTVGAGVIWWYPEAIQVPGLFIWGGGSLSLFDANGSVLPAAAVFGAR